MNRFRILLNNFDSHLCSNWKALHFSTALDSQIFIESLSRRRIEMRSRDNNGNDFAIFAWIASPDHMIVPFDSEI